LAQKKKKERKETSKRSRWLTPVILAINEAKIRRITIRGQPWQIVQETPSLKQPEQNALVAQVVDAYFASVKPCKSKSHQKKKKKNSKMDTQRRLKQKQVY
jgi:hypothetical protein